MKGWESMQKVLHIKELWYNPEILNSKLIICHHNEFMASYIRIEKTFELMGKK